MKDFINVYLEAEAILLEKIQAYKINLANLAQEKNACEIYNIQENTRFASSQPSQNGFLKVSILEAQNLKPLDWRITNNSFVSLNLNGIFAQTKMADSMNPKWNETFELFFFFFKSFIIFH